MDPLFIVIDLFCGAGGTTTGFEQTNGTAKVIACVNHDPLAIKSHWQNHPDVLHFEEDIRTLKMKPLISIARQWQARYPNAYLVLWASLECTNFSKAKGGQPRDADSRTLADHLDRYITALQPDYVQIENVVEFMSWGPLDAHGKPISRKNGSDWLTWKNRLCSYGYTDQWRELNSANFGSYTSRNRLFGIFARPCLPIAWPEATHAKKPTIAGMHGNLKKWMAVKDVLDFKDEGESIFNRKKPLSDKTLERIYAGLLKYVAKGDTSFISKYYSGRPAGKVSSINQPAGTITTVGGQTLVQPISMLKYNSTNGDTGKHIPPSINEPSPVVSCQGRLGLIQGEFLLQPEFLDVIYGNGYPSSIENPAPTIRTKDGLAKVRPEYFIDNRFLQSAQNQSIHQPAGCIMTNDKHSIVEATPFLMPTNYDNLPKSVEDPAPTITANRKHHYIVNPSHGGHTTSTDAPCPVIIARQDKAPLYLVQADMGNVSIAVYECDSEAMVRIKEFMCIYSLVDIKMRMLRVHELLRIQGFPAGYKLAGNQSDQKKFIGNSVEPIIPKVWTEAMAQKLKVINQRVA